MVSAVVGFEDGETAVHLARAAIERAVGPQPPRDPAEPFRRSSLPKRFDEPRGVFVTLNEASDGSLRGCIGFPRPDLPLRVAIPRAAAGAAVEDPRFPPVTSRDLGEFSIEVSLLTVPEPIDVADAADRSRLVRVGQDGLIVETVGASGLLLPQVAVEQGWDATTFLAQTCVKAGLAPESWRSPKVKVLRFQAEVFGEERPGGRVVPHPTGST